MAPPLQLRPSLAPTGVLSSASYNSCTTIHAVVPRRANSAANQLANRFNQCFVAKPRVVNISTELIATNVPENAVAGSHEPETEVVSHDAVTLLAPSSTAATSLSALPGVLRFTELGVDALLVSGLQQQGIIEPSPIQAAAIPAILAGENCALQSFTGSGKTLAFLLPIMTLALARAADEETQGKGGKVSVQAVVVSPSQELAMQTVRVAQSMLPPVARDMVQQVIGGANARRQHEALTERRPALVVGTPGRLSEMVRLGWLRLHQCRILVLDEADQLLAPNFNEDMSHVMEHTGKKLTGVQRQTVLVSATLTEKILALSKASKWCPSPKFITAAPVPVSRPLRSPYTSMGPTEAAGGKAAPGWGWGVRGWDGSHSEFAVRTVGSAGGVAQSENDVPPLPPHVLHFYLVSEPQHKSDALRRCGDMVLCGIRLIHARCIQRALVFVNFQQRAKDIQFRLEGRGMQAAALHGEMPKMQRQAVLNDFRRGRTRVLAVSDVVARGLDVPDCDAVIHMELPSGSSHYAHRAGRTGRMGAPGVVISIVARDEIHVVQKLGAQLDVPILEAHLSHGQMLLGSAPSEASRNIGSDGAGSSDEEDADSRKASNRSSSSTAKDRVKPERRTRKAEQFATPTAAAGEAADQDEASPVGYTATASTAPPMDEASKRAGDNAALGKGIALKRSLLEVFSRSMAVPDSNLAAAALSRLQSPPAQATSTAHQPRTSTPAKAAVQGAARLADTNGTGRATPILNASIKPNKKQHKTSDNGKDSGSSDEDEMDDKTFEAALIRSLEQVAQHKRNGGRASTPTISHAADSSTDKHGLDAKGNGSVSNELAAPAVQTSARGRSTWRHELQRELAEIKAERDHNRPTRKVQRQRDAPVSK